MSEVLLAVHGIPVLLVVETLGQMNDAAYEILGRNITDVYGDSREVSVLFRRLSVIIQRFNAALFHDTFTLHDDPDL